MDKYEEEFIKVCYVEYEQEVLIVKLVFTDGKYADSFLSHELQDDVSSWEEFLDKMGYEYYDTLDDYKINNVKSFEDFLLENNLSSESYYDDDEDESEDDIWS